MKEISEKVLEAVKAAAKEGRLTCAEARKLGEELGVPLNVIGAAADELKIKIRNCELGCF